MMTPAQVGIAGEVKPYQMMRPHSLLLPLEREELLAPLGVGMRGNLIRYGL